MAIKRVFESTTSDDTESLKKKSDILKLFKTMPLVNLNKIVLKCLIHWFVSIFYLKISIKKSLIGWNWNFDITDIISVSFSRNSEVIMLYLLKYKRRT